MIKAGKSFRFLIINSKPNRSTNTEKYPEFFRDSQGKIIHQYLNADVEASLKRFRDDIVAKLTEEELSRLDVREYNLPITHTMTIINPDSDNAKIQFEVFHYVPREGAQPVFVIEREKHPEVFKNLLQSFENAYNQATPVQWEKL